MSPQPTGQHLLYVDATDLDPDLFTVDMLARVALQVRRCGHRVVLRGVSQELAGLIELAGLCDALPIDQLRPGLTPPRY